MRVVSYRSNTRIIHPRKHTDLRFILSMFLFFFFNCFYFILGAVITFPWSALSQFLIPFHLHPVSKRMSPLLYPHPEPLPGLIGYERSHQMCHLFFICLWKPSQLTIDVLHCYLSYVLEDGRTQTTLGQRADYFPNQNYFPFI